LKKAKAKGKERKIKKQARIGSRFHACFLHFPDTVGPKE
jgi:hypothetical protein